MNSILNNINKEVLLIVAIAVVIYLILNYTNKGNKSSLPEAIDSEIPMTENFMDDDEVDAPVPMSAAEFEQIIQKKPVVSINEEVAEESNLADFYNDNLKGVDKEYNVSSNDTSLPTNNINSGYTLGVNMNDPELKKLGAVPDTNRLISDDLLPKKSEDWFETPNTGTTVEDANLLADAMFRGGINTVGNTNKNANYDMYRENIPNPKIVVSPWNNSSYDPAPSGGVCA
jgi:hypothetical protein